MAHTANTETVMRTLILVTMGAILALLAPSSAWAAAHEGGTLNIDSRLEINGWPITFTLRIDPGEGLNVRGRVTAGDKEYNLRLRIDGDDLGRPDTSAPRPAPERL
jgi:hypothetical protein